MGWPVPNCWPLKRFPPEKDFLFPRYVEHIGLSRRVPPRHAISAAAPPVQLHRPSITIGLSRPVNCTCAGAFDTGVPTPAGIRLPRQLRLNRRRGLSSTHTAPSHRTPPVPPGHRRPLGLPALARKCRSASQRLTSRTKRVPLHRLGFQPVERPKDVAYRSSCFRLQSSAH